MAGHPNKRETMSTWLDTNLAPLGSVGSGAVGTSDVFGFRRRSSALTLINRGLANWYPVSTTEPTQKQGHSDYLFATKMKVLTKNPHIFRLFQERVAESEHFANNMCARLVLEEFMKDLFFVGKVHLIQQQSKRFQYSTRSRSLVSTSFPSSSRLPLRTPSVVKPTRQLSMMLNSTKSLTASESSSQSSIEPSYSSESPSVSPDPKKTVTFIGMGGVSAPHIPVFRDDEEAACEASFMN
jgi:hypothetical protein